MPLFSARKAPPPALGGLIVGLGNPGPRYAKTRHNMGFMVLEALLDRLGRSSHCRPEELAQGKKFNSFLWRCRFPGVDLPWLLAMPQTFMNLSGDAVQPMMAWYKLGSDALLVVHDELDLPPGRMMLKAGGGLAGHNGLKSIAQRLSTQDFLRLRLGIGRPPDKDAMVSWVTDRFFAQEAEVMADLVPRAAEAVIAFARDGLAKTATFVNGKKKTQISS